MVAMVVVVAVAVAVVAGLGLDTTGRGCAVWCAVVWVETVQGGMCARGCVRGALVAWPIVVWCEVAVGGVVWSGVV